jgi:hypothetical protein
MNIFNEITLTVKRLIKINITIGASPIRRSENFKTRDITATTTEPLAVLTNSNI